MAVRRNQPAIDEVRELYRRSGGKTPRLGERELADLYRGAMFGARPPDESDRERAIACLTKLLDALEGAHA